jgi:hypothetical protein
MPNSKRGRTPSTTDVYKEKVRTLGVRVFEFLKVDPSNSHSLAIHLALSARYGHHPACHCIGLPGTPDLAIHTSP